MTRLSTSYPVVGRSPNNRLSFFKLIIFNIYLKREGDREGGRRDRESGKEGERRKEAGRRGRDGE